MMKVVETDRQALEKCPSGIPGLDEITNGGLPRGRPTLVCGTAGCGMEFLVTLPDGRIRSVFASRIRGYEVLPRKGMVRFQLHGAYFGVASGRLLVRDPVTGSFEPVAD